jgi:hypothetical protein
MSARSAMLAGAAALPDECHGAVGRGGRDRHRLCGRKRAEADERGSNQCFHLLAPCCVSLAAPFESSPPDAAPDDACGRYGSQGAKKHLP